MKKRTLKLTGLAALAALMILNIQLFEVDPSSGISLASLENMAYAQTEDDGGSGGNCTANDPGECVAEASCENYNSTGSTSICCVGLDPNCSSGNTWVDCGNGRSTLSCTN